MTDRNHLRIGIVCPYSLDLPGGVQFHIRDFAAEAERRGHTVEVIAPASPDTDLPDGTTSSGPTVNWHYNGSVARLSFGPGARHRVAAWLRAGHFDLVHVHEPGIPSISFHALRAATVPVVATFHAALDHSLLLHTAYPMLRPSYEKIAAGIAVSDQARRTVVEHMGTDPLVIPNGIEVAPYREAAVRDEWRGTEDAPTLCFLGRLDEPRKGLGVLGAAAPAIRAAQPGVRFLVAGNGNREAALDAFGDAADAVELLGPLSEADKRSLFASSSLYVAPHLGGESFGIVLIEAMAAGTPVLAADLPAFTAVTDHGRCGRHFVTGHAADLAEAAIALLQDPAERELLSYEADRWVARYDWSAVTDSVLRVYDMVLYAERAMRPPRSHGLGLGAPGGDL